MQPRLALLTFGAGLPNWRAAALRLTNQAEASGWFSDVFRLTERDLRRNHPQFWSRHRAILKPTVRGFGYWIWKPLIIAETLARLKGRADVLVYLDAGHELNLGTRSVETLFRYCDMALTGPGTFAMSLTGHPEWQWTKSDVFELVGLSRGDRESAQLQAHPFLRVDQKNIRFALDWLALCERDGYHYLDDSPSVLPEHSGFIEHRHDQSLFSALAKACGHQSIPDETYWAPDWALDGACYPIWAVRNRSRFSITRNDVTALWGRTAEKAYSRWLSKVTWERQTGSR